MAADFDMDDVFGGMMSDDNQPDIDFIYDDFIDKVNLSIDLKKPATEFDILVHSIKDQHAKRLNEELKALKGADFITAYMSLMQYIQPKYKSIDVNKPKAKKRVLEIKHHTVKKETA